MSQIKIFESKLMSLKPIDDEFPSHIDERIDAIPDDLHESLIPSVFRFYESHPLIECGMLGGLVHLIEDYYPNYKPLLVSSIKKSPNYSSILMVNRILNSELSISERNEYTAILEEICNNNSLDQELRDEAKYYLDYQSQKNS